MERQQQHQGMAESHTNDMCHIEGEVSNFEGDLLQKQGWNFSSDQESGSMDKLVSYME